MNEILNEEVYVEQPRGFIDPCSSDRVYKLKKALCGLEQAPRACYECLAEFLTSNGHMCGEIEKLLFINK